MPPYTLRITPTSSMTISSTISNTWILIPQQEGSYDVQVEVRNEVGIDTRDFTIGVGSQADDPYKSYLPIIMK